MGLFGICLLAGIASAQDKPPSELRLNRPLYQIEIDLDYKNASLTGREVVRFTNPGREDIDNVSFNLYPNVGLSEDEEPWLIVQHVSAGGRELKFSSRSRYTVLRVDLANKLQAGQSLDLTLEFMARVPRVQREETSLLAHFLDEVNDALSDERQLRDARDIFFAAEEAMLLGYFHPMLAVRPLQVPEQSLVAGVGGMVFCEAADYEVTVRTRASATIITSGREVHSTSVSDSRDKSASRSVSLFRGENLRGFAIVLAERVKRLEQQVGPVRVVSYFREGEERLGKRALGIAAASLRIYSQLFGNYPYPTLQVVELPLTAGYAGVEFPALMALAQAYYIDFDAPQAARLPGVLREQADVIKSSFEFNLAHGIAHQWWGGVVGSDPERTPYLDESLSTFAAAYYHEVAYGELLGQKIIEQQLRGGYLAYRMLGGIDQEADKPLKEFKSALQYTAMVQSKPALMLVALRKELGDERFFGAIRSYYSANQFRIAPAEGLRGAFSNAADDPRPVRSLFQRWLKEKHGDEDIGTPDLSLLPPPVSKMRALGRVFIKIGKTAARPF